MPKRPAFKGTAPINLSDRLNQVLRWALGSVEIFFSRHSPLLYGHKGGKLKFLERFAYINTTVYPFTSLPLLAYCILPAVCLLTGKFIMPTVMPISPFTRSSIEVLEHHSQKRFSNIFLHATSHVVQINAFKLQKNPEEAASSVQLILLSNCG